MKPFAKNFPFILQATILAACWIPILAINNGIPSDITKEPWTVGIINKTQGFCGGAILSPNFVVTAASCVNENQASDIKVHYGGTDRTYGFKEAMVKTIYKFAKYDPKTLENDIALLEIEGKLDLDQLTSKKIELPDQNYCPKKDEMVLVSGWGAQEYNPHLSNVLKAANFTVRDNRKCNPKWITENHFCAGGFGVALEYGDNGDPGVENGKLVGLGMWRSDLYSSSEDPSIFLCIGYFVDWILKIIHIK